MLRTAQSLPQKGFDAGLRRRTFPSDAVSLYRATWQLPGPDSPRQATTSLGPKTTYMVTSGLRGARKVEAKVPQAQFRVGAVTRLPIPVPPFTWLCALA